MSQPAATNPRILDSLRLAGALALGAAVFWAVFSLHLKSIPEASYRDRDDAVITLSHARNLVEFGFVGVSPSGERIEGFSAPLQFWLSAGAYAITRADYSTLLRVQTFAGTLALGALLAGMLLTPAFSNGARRRLLLGAIGVLACAQIVASSRAFLLWHASGMENVYKTALLAALLWSLDGMLRTGRVYPTAYAIVFAALLTRIDAVVPVSILLLAFAALWWRSHHNARAVRFVALSMLPWLVYMVWRRWYFGAWEPNTAVAQGIAVSGRLDTLLNAPWATVGDYWSWLLEVGRSLHAFQLLWLLPLAAVLRRHTVAQHRAVLLAAGATGAVVQYALFGPARMDVARTVTELAMYSALAVPFVLLGAREFRALHLAAGVLILGSSLAITARLAPDRGVIGWGADAFEGGARSFAELARSEALPRPTVANPDLGAVSWHKQVNVADLGRLGSAVVPRLENPGRYITEFLAPDIIELHDAWSCEYRDLFATPVFNERYVAVQAERTPYIVANCPDASGAMTGIWIRRAVMKGSGSPERAFIDAFGPQLDTALLERELARCLGEAGDRPCAHVGRTLVRFVPELKRAGRYQAVATLLDGDPRLRVERAFVTSSTEPHWWRDVIAAWQPLAVAPLKMSVFAIADGSRSSQSTVSIRDQLDLGWRLEPPLDLFDVTPRSGRGSATVAIVPRAAAAALDRTATMPVFVTGRTDPVATIAIRYKTMTSVDAGPPMGSVDTPADPIALADTPVTIQGWAVDAFDMRGVSVAYADAGGRTIVIGKAALAGTRPDVAAAFPHAHDIFNSGWTFVLEPRMLRGIPRPVVLRFLARGSRREVEIGMRTVVR